MGGRPDWMGYGFRDGGLHVNPNVGQEGIGRKILRLDIVIKTSGEYLPGHLFR